MESICEKPDLHPLFKNKAVYKVWCIYCENNLSNRTMKAILLANIKIDLYSTDFPPKPSVDLIGKYYTTKTCNCKIRDIACIKCGNPVGYHVVLPCVKCLESCNNGHFWIFHQHTTTVAELLNESGSDVVTWGDLDSQQQKQNLNQHEEDDDDYDLCR